MIFEKPLIYSLYNPYPIHFRLAIGLNKYQDHVEVYLRSMISWPYYETVAPSTNIMVRYLYLGSVISWPYYESGAMILATIYGKRQTLAAGSQAAVKAIWGVPGSQSAM